MVELIANFRGLVRVGAVDSDGDLDLAEARDVGGELKTCAAKERRVLALGRLATITFASDGAVVGHGRRSCIQYPGKGHINDTRRYRGRIGDIECGLERVTMIEYLCSFVSCELTSGKVFWTNIFPSVIELDGVWRCQQVIMKNVPDFSK